MIKRDLEGFFDIVCFIVISLLMNGKLKVGLVHGMGADKDWECFPWLEAELSVVDVSVDRRSIDPEKGRRGSLLKNPDEWENFAAQYLDSRVGVVGHSVGGIALLRALESYEGAPLKFLLLVASYARVFETEKKGLAKRIIPILEMRDGFDWEAIESKVDTIVVMGSMDDPHVPVEEVEFLAGKLGVSPTIYQDKGHFGGIEFPELKKQIMKLLEI